MTLFFKIAAEAAKIETGASKVFSLCISRVTGGRFSHVEIGLHRNPNGTWHSFASREPDGTGFLDIDFSDASLWVPLVIPTNVLEDAQMQAWCQGCDLRPYNMVAILGLLTDEGWTEPHGMICSQCAAKLLQNVKGWFTELPCWAIAPDGFVGDPKRYGLYELIEKELTG